MHAYVEIYFPGYGWVPLEPQYPGSLFGTIPPVPGYLPIVKGLGEVIQGNQIGFITFVYTGTVATNFTYTYRIYPSSAMKGRISLDVVYPCQLYFNDSLKIHVSPEPPDARIVTTITAPNGTSHIYIFVGTRDIDLFLDDTGSWHIEVFSTKEGYFPAYYMGNISVYPRPLKIEILASGLEHLFKPTLVIRTVPGVANATIYLAIESLVIQEKITLYTNSTGVAVYEPLVILGPTTVRIVATARGYETAALTQHYDNTSVAVLYTLIAVASMAVMLSVSRRTKKRSNSSLNNILSEW